MVTGRLLQLAWLFGPLSFLAIGGVNAIVPEMQRQAVTVHHWMSAADFAALYALGQAAPGPNFLVVTLVGFRVAGLSGAAVATAALIGPSSLLTYGVARLWMRFRAARWREVLQAGLTPLTVGLVLAASVLLASSVATGPARLAVMLAAAAATLAGRVHPLLLLAGGAAAGAAGALN